MTNNPPPPIALLACSVFENEIRHLAGGQAHILETRYFEMGLHDRPEILRNTLHEAIEAVDSRDDIEAIVLAYGLCGCGTAGLGAARHPVVIPRGHDCITVFLGHKDRYATHQSACPSCYYYTPGWNRGRRVPGPDKLGALREELLERYDEDDVDFLIESEQEAWAQHDTVSYLDLGTDDAESEADYARRCAEFLDWKFERLNGDPSMLRDLLLGRWDDPERFQIIPPGHQLAHSPDDRIMKTTEPGL